MKTVKEVLAAKGAAVTTISPDASVLSALISMAENEIGALIVLENDRVVGIISERDYARKVVLKGKFSENTPVREIMSAPPLVVNPGQSVEECMALMTNKRFRHLPVLDDGRLVGIVSIGALDKNIISDQKFLIQDLKEYICGAPTVR